MGFVEQYDGISVGCFWMLIPQTKEIFYDSFRNGTDEMVLCGAYVGYVYSTGHLIKNFLCIQLLEKNVVLLNEVTSIIF